MNIKTAYFEITNVCNLNCTTCYNRSGLNSKEEISPKQLIDSINILKRFGLNRVLISGGEPTLHSRFDEILDILKQYPEMSFGIVTNGTIHNQKMIDTINNNINYTLQISLDGSCEEKNRATRGVGNFAKTMEFARSIKREKEKLLLKMVISQNNIDDIEGFFNLALSLGFTPEFSFVNRRGNACDSWNDMDISPKQKLSVIKKVEKLNKEYNINAFLPLCTSSCSFTNENSSFSLCIKTDGDIQPCSLLYAPEFKIGNIFEFDSEEYFSRTKYIAELAKKRMSCDYGCNRCIMNESCGRGCMGEAYLLNGDVFADDGDCEFRKMQLAGFTLKQIRNANHGE